MLMKRDHKIGAGVCGERTSPVRVMFLAPSMTLAGPQRQLLYLAKGLDRARFEPVLAILGDGQPENSYDYRGVFSRVFKLNIPSEGNFALGRIPWLALGALRLLRILREERPEIVHAFLPVPSVMGALVSKLAGVPVFIVGRRSLSALPRRGSRILTWIDRFPFKLADAILANCAAIAKETAEVDGVAADEIHTIPNGVDLETFSSGRDSALRQELGFHDDDVVFGIVANFFACKGHGDFIEAARLIHRECANSRFLIVGVDHGTLPQVRQQICANGLADVIRIVPGTRMPQAYYRAMDAYICSSQSEGMSNSVAEAMCSGLPVIATIAGGNPELIKHGETGFLAAVGEPEEMACLGRRLCTDHVLRESIGARARASIEVRFPAVAMVRAHEKLYAELLGLSPNTMEGDFHRPSLAAIQ